MSRARAKEALGVELALLSVRIASACMQAGIFWSCEKPEFIMIKVLIKKLSHKAQIPIYKTEGSSGMDLMALTEDKILIKPNKSALVPTGLSVAIPNDDIQKAYLGMIPHEENFQTCRKKRRSEEPGQI